MLSKRSNLERWITQVVALTMGIGGIVCDYVFGLMAPDHVPVVLYCMVFGVGFGLDPAFYTEKLFGRSKGD